MLLGHKTTGLPLRSSQAEGERTVGRRGYLAASPQAGGGGGGGYGYDAEVYLRFHLGELGAHSQLLPTCF